MKEFFCWNFHKHTVWCIPYDITVSQTASESPLATTRQSRLNFYSDIALQLESHGNRQVRARIHIYVYVINPDIAAKRQPGNRKVPQQRSFDAAPRCISRDFLLHHERERARSPFRQELSFICAKLLTESSRIHDPSFCALQFLSSREEGKREIHSEKERTGRASFWRNKISKWVSW